MADDTDVLLKFCEQMWTEAQRAEEQRTAITNITLLIASAIIGLLSQSPLTIAAAPLTVLLIILGLYGAIASEKLYERHQLHHARLRSLRERLAELHSRTELVERFDAVRKIHEGEHYPRLSKIRLHHIWLLLHLAITASGLILTAIAIAL